MPEQLGVGTLVPADAPVRVNASTAAADRKITKARTHNMRSLSAQGYAKQACVACGPVCLMSHTWLHTSNCKVLKDDQIVINMMCMTTYLLTHSHLTSSDARSVSKEVTSHLLHIAHKRLTS